MLNVTPNDVMQTQVVVGVLTILLGSDAPIESLLRSFAAPEQLASITGQLTCGSRQTRSHYIAHCLAPLVADVRSRRLS